MDGREIYHVKCNMHFLWLSREARGAAVIAEKDKFGMYGHPHSPTYFDQLQWKPADQ